MYVYMHCCLCVRVLSLHPDVETYMTCRFLATYAATGNFAAEIELPDAVGEARGITAYELRRGLMDSLNLPPRTSLTLLSTSHGPRAVTDFDCFLYLKTPTAAWKPRYRQLQKSSAGLIRLREFFLPLA